MYKTKAAMQRDTLRPDFKFRCNTTQQEFNVDAKYRSAFNAFLNREFPNLQTC